MKHVFIMNPLSGKKRSRQHMIDAITSACTELGEDYEIYFTEGPFDCKRHARQLCEEAAACGREIRIYGCGGDGTVNELVNGVHGFTNVEIGAIPMGTGNDYIRNYGNVSSFLDIKAQIKGESRYSDAIYYRAEYEDAVTEGYCANMFNIGFDCNVVDMTARVKNWPFVGGSLAYLISVAIILIKKKGADLVIEYDDGTKLDGKILLTAIANGCFCGGGVKGVPDSVLDDGLMDISVVKDVSRLTFVMLFPSYAKGTHLTKKKIIDRDIVRYTKEKALTVTANGESLRLCTDGEITTQKKVTFSIEENAFRFIVPSA
ncbi:MAG: diacylglycerol kinase family protein [Bacillota bacterium]|nr:diacylglycerol kinase family protein [Bacillota bacterium]